MSPDKFGMTKKQWIILGLLVLFFVVVSLFGISSKNKNLITKQENESTSTFTDVVATGTKRVEFVSEIPKDATETIPKEQYAVGGSNSSFGVYEIGISKTGFSQTNLTVKKDDFVKVEVTGVDGDYDFSIPQYGTYALVKQGETKKITFIPSTAGTFLFECRDKCPNGQKINGRFIVLPK